MNLAFYPMFGETYKPKNEKVKIPQGCDKEKELLETNRNSTISLNQIFDNERQQSTNFRFTFNVKFLYENDLIGTTNYGPYLNNLYLI